MDPSLYEAARSGDTTYLQKVDKNSPLLFQETPRKNNILHISAEFKQVLFFREATQLCPTLFSNPNAKGDTPLHVASRVGCLEMVDFIINHARTLYADVEGGTTCQDFLRMVNVNKDNCLHVAVRSGHHKVAKSLVEADCELANFVNSAEESVLYIAASREFSDIALMILSNCRSCFHEGTKGMTALHAALYYQLNGTMKKIVGKRKDMIQKKDILGWTPLHYAAHFGNVKAIELFLKYDRFAAYIPGKDGESALGIASFRGRTEVMEMLLDSCPDIYDVVDNQGRTALHAAVLGGKENSVRYILGNQKLTSLVNEADEDGNTPLHLAALHRKYDIISILARDKRVDIKATNKKNLTALGIYNKYREHGFAAAKVFFMLNETYGIPDMQAWVSTHATKMRSKEPEEMIVEENIKSRHISFPEKGNMLEIHLLVAMLIATVTFAAAFTLPGGYKNDAPNEGMANLATKVAFKAFVVFDTLAFCSSVGAVYLQFGTSGGGHYERARFVNVAVILIFIAILTMVLAFASGMYIVLEKSIGIGITAYVIAGCFVLAFFIRWFVDPLGKPDLGLQSVRKNLRNLLFRYGVF